MRWWQRKSWQLLFPVLGFLTDIYFAKPPTGKPLIDCFRQPLFTRPRYTPTPLFFCSRTLITKLHILTPASADSIKTCPSSSDAVCRLIHLFELKKQLPQLTGPSCCLRQPRSQRQSCRSRHHQCWRPSSGAQTRSPRCQPSKSSACTQPLHQRCCPCQPYQHT